MTAGVTAAHIQTRSAIPATTSAASTTGTEPSRERRTRPASIGRQLHGLPETPIQSPERRVADLRMKPFDRLLRNWRILKAGKYIATGRGCSTSASPTAPCSSATS